MEHDEDCPHEGEFTEATRCLAGAIPRFLAVIGVLDKCDLSFVLVSRVCSCRHIVTHGPTVARAAAEELNEAAKIMEQQGAVPTAPGGSA